MAFQEWWTTSKGSSRKLTQVRFFFHVVLELDFSNSQVQVVSNFFELLKDIKMDEKGIHEYKISLGRLRRRKEDLEKRIKENKAFVVGVFGVTV